ncbi:MAG: radical SAM family heme chaperone HemW [Burkholderiaceae bacterium]|nr:radical SAM family heme chaperone HemW [Burkholderiaceae bacterium]
MAAGSGGPGAESRVRTIARRPAGEESSGVRSAPPLSVYVHLPWCVRKCPYCDFNSHAVLGNSPAVLGNSHAALANSPAAPGNSHASPDGDEVPEHRYLDALRADLEAALPEVWGRPVQTIFVGGGTPSLFSPESIDALLTMLRTLLPVVPGAEITMEANPGTFEAARFRAFAQAGVTRLSIGVQSFDDDALRRIGRVHDAAQARRAIETAAQHFDSWNLDLMYALPGQTLDALRADLREALSFAPPHLSYYHLTLEPNTAFALRPPVLPDEDAASDMQSLIEDETQLAGLQHYEVSAYARRHRRCAHNLNYWQFGDYLGLGAGAHGKLSFQDRIVREARVRNPREYMRAALGESREGPIASSHAVPARELPFEFMLNALRLTDGVPAAWFVERTGLSTLAIADPVARAVERGLLDPDPTAYRPTALGARFLNDLQQMFLPEQR